MLFGGAADAMRRQALPPIREALARRASAGAPPRDAAILDVACGAGAFLRELKANFPAARVAGLDLSPDYLSLAAERLADWRRGVDFVHAPAEEMPFEDASFDVVTSVYLFHELPQKVRLAVAREVARVLKPGGVFVFVDTIMEGDHPPFDGLLARFPVQFHEPYYAEYVRSDVAALFEEAGLQVDGVDRAFLSRVMTLRKPDAARG
ncbi:MAG: class I SAM-dependent methyltransferase [Pseudomonadota bacterium]